MAGDGMMKKGKDQSVYETFLTMHFSVELLTDYISDMESELRMARKLKKSTGKRLEKCKEKYREIYGMEPIIKK
jgi:hypothetical protein